MVNSCRRSERFCFFLPSATTCARRAFVIVFSKNDAFLHADDDMKLDQSVYPTTFDTLCIVYSVLHT
jgi:hypothetical protein